MSFRARLDAAAAAQAPPAAPRPAPTTGTPNDTPYGMRALSDECDLVARAGEGTRNDTLNKAAFRMGRRIAEGYLTEQTARDNLHAAARSAGLPAPEADATIQSGLSKGQLHPRVIADRTHTPTGVGRDVSPPALADSDATPEHTSWWFRDLDGVIDGTQTEPGPVHLTRSDGQALFYAGKVNGLIGESESGKTWVALLAVQQALAGGERVLYLDFEDSASGIVGRLRALGTAPDELARFAYIDPDETLHIAAKMDLGAVLDTHQPGLIVLDGFNAAMTLLGLDLQSNKDATTFSQALLKPLSRTAATVVYIDHLPKNREAQGKGGIGAQAKRAMTTGCALRVDVAVEFGRGMTGRLKLTVDKDRAGHVRAASAGAKAAGQAVLVSAADGQTVDMHIEAPDLRPADERGPWRPTNLMEKVSRLLESVGEPLSKAAIKNDVKGDHKAIDKAIDALVEDGLVSKAAGSRGAILCTLIKPFRDPSNDLGATSVDLGGHRGQIPPNDLGGSVRPLGSTEHRGGDEAHKQPDLGGTEDTEVEEQWWQK